MQIRCQINVKPIETYYQADKKKRTTKIPPPRQLFKIKICSKIIRNKLKLKA